MSSNFPIHHGIRLANDGFIVNARVEQLATDPVILDIGRIWYNTTEQVFKIVVDDGTGAGVKRVIGTQEAITLLQTEINSTQTGAGLGSDGAYTADGTTNYLTAATSLKDADKKLDTQVKTVADGLATEITDRTNAVSAVQSELDATQTGAGLGASGTYTAPVGSNYLGSASSLKDADSKLDTQIKTVADNLASEVTNRTNADSAIQTELDATQTGAGLGSDGAYTADATTNYISAATSLKDADKKLDTQIKTVADNLATETTNRTNADTALDGRISTIEGSYIKKDGSVAFTGNIDAGSHKIVNVTNPTSAQDAATKDYVDDEIAILASQITALGNAFNYVGTIAGGADAGSATDMALQAENDTGDFYKVSTAGYFKHSTVTAAFFANVNDGIVFNSAGGIDKIDNTDSTVSGTTNYISVTGSADTGFVVDVAADFKTRMSDAEADIAQEIIDRGTADSAIQSELDATQTGAGLGASGTYTADATTNYLTAATSLKDADKKLDTQIKTVADNLASEVTNRTNADSAIQTELDATQTGAGLGSDGAYTAPVGSNYLGSASSLKDADSKLDTQVKTVADNLATEVTNRTNADSAIQTELDATQTGAGLGSDGAYTADGTTNYIAAATSLKDADKKLDTKVKAVQDEVDATQTGAGLGTDGAYTANGSSNYLTAATSLKDADNKLDAQIKTVADGLASEITNRTNADSAIQTELDATQTGAGLGSDGTYSANGSSNYLTAAVSLKDADNKLDAKIKAMFDAINGANFYQEYSTAATEHTVEHGLNSAAITFTVMVDRDGSGDWRNDVVSVKHTDNNTLTVYLSVAKKIRVSVQKVADISI